MRYLISIFAILVMAGLAAFGVAGLGLVDASASFETIALSSLALGASYAVGDAALSVTRALPNGAANVTSTAIDLGHGTNGLNLANHEFLLSAPAMNATQLPNAQTMTYDIVTSANADLSGPTTAITAVLVQTGADSAGAAATTKRFRLPTDCQRYVGVKATKSGTGDATAAIATLALKF